MQKIRLQLAKFRHQFRRWRSIAIKELLAPLTDTNARIEFLSLLILLFVILPPKGYTVWREQVSHTITAIEVFILAFVAYAFLSAVIAIFKTKNELKTLGEWHEHRFIYYEPQRVFAAHVSDKDNDKTLLFKVIDPEIGSLVQTKIDFEAMHGRVQAQVVLPNDKNIINWAGWHPGIRVSLRLQKDRMFGLRINAIANTDITTVRVYILSWEL